RRSARGISLGNERQREEVILGETLLLPTFRVQVLAEVPFAIHQAHANERYAEVTGALEMVAREYAQTAGVNRDALVNAELGGEVRDASIGFGGKVGREPGRSFQVVIERLRDAIHVSEKAIVAGKFLEPALAGRAEEPDGTVVE